MVSSWNIHDMPSLDGQTAIVTGANSGIGYWTAHGLAAAGARVILACRNVERGEEAIARIRADHPSASLELRQLDLADLDSVTTFADAYDDEQLHILVNNAGVMALPHRTTTQGFEMQLGINHLGHFALTGLLFDALSATPGARVVNVSSLMHRFGRMRFDDLQSERSYARWPAYGQSKLANLLFTHALARRASAASIDLLSVAAHPGYTQTHLHLGAAEMEGDGVASWVLRTGSRWFAQPAPAGALPSLRAATDPDAQQASFYGPAGFAEIAGPPVLVESSAAARDRAVADRLWDVSIELTGITWLATG